MANALVLLAAGFEEIEAAIIIDVLRRAEVEVTSASLFSTTVVGAHSLTFQADTQLDAVGSVQFDVVVLPGGQPGSRHLRDDSRVQQLLREQNAAGRLVAAICAAPIALEAAGVLKGKAATVFPGYDLPSANYTEAPVVVDSNIVTSRGPGTAFEFVLTLVERLVGAATATKLRQSMLIG